jgi:hypothetical protein
MISSAPELRATQSQSHVQKRYPCLTIATVRPLLPPNNYRICSTLDCSLATPRRIYSRLQPTTSLEQAIQTTATSQRTHDTRTNTTARRSTSASVIHILALRRIALWWVALLRVHRLLLVLHGRLVVAWLLAAVIVVLGGWRAIWTRSAHGWGRRTVLLPLVRAGVVGLGGIARRRSLGSFVGHCCGGVIWWLGFGG